VIRSITLALALAMAPAMSSAAGIAVTPANVLAVYKAAQPGDALHMTGNFGFLALQGARTFAPPLNVDASGATFSAVVIKDASGLVWSGGNFAPVAGRPAMTLSGGKGVSVDGIAVNSDGTQKGVFFVDAADVTLSNSNFNRPSAAVTLLRVAHAHVTGNVVTGWSADGFGLQSVTDSIIEKNVCVRPIRIDATHIDCVQGYFSNPANARVTVRDNVVYGFDTQGIFFNAYAGFANPQGIVIEGNTVITGNAPNGILLQNDPAGQARHNRTATLPGSKWRTDVKIMDPGTAHCDNVTEGYAPWPAVSDGPCAAP
jgi:hypothetical protein